ncbi:hypothetical protein, partial [Shigella sonnei]|uniref:hypothetical protein n=1 Tax=Shigella sonnei TaxID=624 RepID=UPI0020946983
PRQPSGKNIIRWLLKKRTNGSVRYCQYTSELDSHGQYSLPASGKYELRVLQTRNDARKNKTKKYNVDIQIK